MTPSAALTVRRLRSVVMDEDNVYLTLRKDIERAIARVRRHSHACGPDAEDFAQDMRVLFVERGGEILQRFSHRAGLDAYLFSVVLHAWVDRWRRSSREQGHLTSIDAEYPPECVAEPRSCSESDALVREAENAAAVERILCALDWAIERLPSQDRRLLLARYAAGRAVDAIASDVCITAKAASNRIYRAIENLHAEVARVGITSNEATAALRALEDGDPCNLCQIAHDGGIPIRRCWSEAGPSCPVAGPLMKRGKSI